MRPFFLHFALLSLIAGPGIAQKTALPVKEFPGNKGQAYVFYISGDGGLNSFSTSLCTAFSQAGHEATALNARSYFWSKKTPAQAAQELGDFIRKKLQGGSDKFVMAGYSFGADVMPFIVNLLPADVRARMSAVILLSPSTTTDFQIHLLDMLGGSSNRNLDVVTAINQMHSPKSTLIFGSDEKDFPMQKVTLKNSKIELLPGGHHFEGNTREVADVMMRNF